MQNRGLNRRTVLKVGGGSILAALALPTLSACSNNSSSAAKTNVSTKGALPTYKAATTVPPADLPGNGGVVDPAYLKFPAELTTGVPAKPGKGNSYTVCVMTYDQPAAADNPQIKAVDEAMGSKFVYQVIPADQHATKTTAMLAGGTLPDVMTVPSWDPPAKLGDGFRHAFYDLTEKLAGDKVLAYPNLANLPSSAWQGVIIDGKIAAVPVPAPPIEWSTYVRTDLLTKAGASMPKTADEMVSVAKSLTDAKARRWGWWDPDMFVRRIYGIANGWNADESGTMRFYWEFPAYKDALALYQKLYPSMHPDAMNATADKKGSFVAGQVVFLDDGVDAWKGWDSAASAKSNDPAFMVDAVVPFAAAGGPVTVWAERTWLVAAFLSKKLSSEQVDEILGMLNYLTSPFGTKENMLVTMGLEGRHYTMTGGVPVPTKLAATELKSQYYFTAQAPRVTTKYDNPEWVKRDHAWQTEVAKTAKVPVGAGLYVDIPAKLQSHAKKPTDAIKEVVRGRMSIADFDGVVKAWQSQYGDELRKLYQAVVDANK